VKIRYVTKLILLLCTEG